MSLLVIPHRFVAGDQFDVERINDNLEAAADGVNSNLEDRYTYCTEAFPLEGITQADDVVMRTKRQRRYTASAGLEIAAVDLVIYATSGVTWTLSCSDTTWPSITLTTAGATTEARALSSARVVVPTGSTGLDFILTGSAANTIATGWLVVTMRADRGSQGDSVAGYTPTLLNALSSTAGALLDTEQTALAAAVTRDGAADKDIRCETFRVRALASGSSKVWRLPSGARRKAGLAMFHVGPGAATFTVDVDGTATNLVGTGVTTIASSVGTLSGTLNNAPTSAADDTIVTLSASGGTVSLGYVTLFWS